MALPVTPAEERLRAAVDRVATRIRAHRAVRAAPLALGVTGVAILLSIVAARAGFLARGHAAALAAVAALVALGVVIRRARAVTAASAAMAADRALGLADRLTSALAFLAEPAPTPLMQLAIADGAAACAKVDPRAVVALAVPRAALALVPLAGLIALAALARCAPAPRATIADVGPRPRLVVEEDALLAERAAVRRLAAQAGGRDPQLAALAAQLDALLQQIDEQRLSRAEAFTRLAALQAQLERDRPAAPPRAQLAALRQALASAKATRAVAEALEHEDLDAAQRELAKLAAAAEARAEAKPPERDALKDELERALDRAAKAVDEAQRQADADRDRKIDALKEEERRLKREAEAHPQDEEIERRLQRNQRELERLEREREQAREQRRQLQRLSRELQQAAEQLRQKLSPEALRRAAEELGKMADEIRRLGSSAQGAVQIAELKEVLRRAGRVESGTGEGRAGGKDGAGGKDPRGRDGKGARGERLAEFDERAGGKPSALLLGGDDPGAGSVMLPLPGDGADPGEAPGDRPGGRGGDRPGDGIGDQHDPDLLGDRTALDAKKKLIRANGRAGDGPSRSQTILGAGERGFAGRDYQRVYQDYTSVVEEVMSQEGVPPGYRYYIKRYFQLIRPRE